MGESGGPRGQTASATASTISCIVRQGKDSLAQASLRSLFAGLFTFEDGHAPLPDLRDGQSAAAGCSRGQGDTAAPSTAILRYR